MKKNRILSSLLCLSLAAGLLIPGLPAYAEGEGESGSSSGMKLSKTAKANGDGTYTITLEAYATGEKVISQVDKDVPTDIVLVLDQSGSMKNPIGTVSFSAIADNQNRNTQLYDRRHNGGSANLWHQLDDGSHVSVSVTLEQKHTYSQVNQNNSYYYYYQSALYVVVDKQYLQVTVSKSERYWNGTSYASDYEYTLPDGTVIAEGRGDNNSPTFNDSINEKVFYQASANANENVYTYTYVDAEGNTQTIGTSTGASTRFNDPTLYQRNINANAGDKKIVALQSAVTTFANSVASKAAGADGKIGTPDDIDHRIAVVGFAARKDTNPGDYVNTELFIGATQYKYGTAAQGQYGNAFQNMKTSQGQGNVAASIGALDAYGGTHIDLGMEMAKGILDNSPVPSGEKRNRVVIVFTDGSPGSGSWSGNDMTYAQNAINYANTIRNSGANVYTVGIFNGADATSAGNQNGTDTQKANWFMQNLSDNKGTPRTPSYYLSAADAGTLNSIFQQIADNIQTGGSSTTLDENAVIKDIISPQFQLPAGTQPSDITVQTVPCTGITNDVPSWGNPETFTDAAITVDANTGAVSVSGFDFAGNYVGMDNINGTEQLHNPAKKLVISFKAVTKAGFLGGNNVYTNTSAGVYENSSADTPVLVFEKPEVNVPIEAVTVTPEDKNVYLLAEVAASELKTGATVKVGDVSLNLTENNYGLETWQNEYVDITVKITDMNGNEVTTDLTKLTDDTTYTITVTVAPKTTPSEDAVGDPATAQSGNGTANINVYKPELTYKDSEVFYGDDAPTDFNSNRTQTVWKHNDNVAPADMGPAPDLIVTYSTEVGKIANGKINSKEDIQVNATVKIKDTDVTTYTIFAHTACNPACGWNETVTPNGNPAFLLHVKTASLTIEKAGNVGDTEGFIFNVVKADDANTSFRVSVQGNGKVTITGLPQGTYTVTEDTDWSWRYKDGVSVSDSSVTLTKESPTGYVTVTNIKKNDYLLDGNAYVQNISKPAVAGN